MLQNNETEEATGLFVKGQRERSKSKRPKRDPEVSNSFSYYFVRKQGTSRKIV